MSGNLDIFFMLTTNDVSTSIIMSRHLLCSLSTLVPVQPVLLPNIRIYLLVISIFFLLRQPFLPLCKPILFKDGGGGGGR